MSRSTFLVIVTMLSSCARPCRRADVERVIAACRVEPAGTPAYTVCVNAGLTPPSFDFVQPAVDACSAEGAAPLFECLSANAATCLDGGVDAAMSVCSRSGPFSMQTNTRSAQDTAACSNTCFSSLRACSNACPTSSWQACAACDEQCARTYRQCDDACS